MKDGLETVIEMPEIKDQHEGKAIMQLSTYKPSSGGLVSYASIVFLKQDGCITCMPFSDFNKRVLVNKTIRCTKKAYEVQHNTAFTPEVIGILKAEAINHYVGK